MWDFVYNYVVPTSVSILAISAVTIGPPIIFTWLKGRGIIVEESRQKMLQTAFDNAAGAIILKAGGGPITKALIEDIAAPYVRDAVPQTVKHFEKQGLNDAGIVKKVEAKLGNKIGVGTVVEAVVDTAVETVIPGRLGEIASDIVIGTARRVSGRAPVSHFPVNG